MQDKQPIRSHRNYEAQGYGGRTAVKKGMAPNFTGTGLRVDMAGCGLDEGTGAPRVGEYGSDLDGRVSR